MDWSQVPSGTVKLQTRFWGMGRDNRLEVTNLGETHTLPIENPDAVVSDVTLHAPTGRVAVQIWNELDGHTIWEYSAQRPAGKVLAHPDFPLKCIEYDREGQLLGVHGNRIQMLRGGQFESVLEIPDGIIDLNTQPDGSQSIQVNSGFLLWKPGQVPEPMSLPLAGGSPDRKSDTSWHLESWQATLGLNVHPGGLVQASESGVTINGLAMPTRRS